MSKNSNQKIQNHNEINIKSNDTIIKKQKKTKQNDDYNNEQYSEVVLTQNWQYIQSNCDERWIFLTAMRDVTCGISRFTSFKDLRQFITVKGQLGIGVYAIVYDVEFRDPYKKSRVPYQFALKLVQTTNRKKEHRAEIIQKILRECQAFRLTNALVKMHISCNFVLSPRNFFTKNADDLIQTDNNENKNPMSYLCACILLEKETSTFKQYLQIGNNALAVEQIMHCIFQIFMGVVAMASHLKMVHNDLYFKNILYSKCKPVHMVYRFRGRNYFLRNCETIIKISDFGIATSPTFLHSRHNDMSHLVSKHLSINRLSDYDFSNHILDYDNVEPYARDVAVVLRSLSLTNGLHVDIQKWVQASLFRLDMYCDEKKMMHSIGLIEYVSDIFSSQFLYLNTRLYGNLFAVPSDIRDYANNIQYFDIDGNTVGHETIKATLLEMASEDNNNYGGNIS